MSGKSLYMRKELLVSFLLHIVLIAGVCVCASYATRSLEPFVVFLTPDSAGGGGGGGSAVQGNEKKEAFQPAPAKPKTGKARARVRYTKTRADNDNETASASMVEQKIVEQAPQMVASNSAAPDPAPLPQMWGGTETGASGGGSGNGAGTGTGSGIGSGTGSGTGTGSGSGVGSGIGASAGSGRGRGESAETLRNRYLKEHFAYIRDLILKNLTYPPIAKKLGWHGGVTVSFVVCENGHTEKIRIVKNSGYDILDQNVVQTIREVEPFPKPPVKAQLVIPVVYRLE
ncbi:MAG: Gram-negative bacterial tonB protein [Syntrophorhabdaceae bacterium PtaU1.Bin034]|nr:MAG: Gram-negative bacterial tonB protein [Syntrophorhabdaceae bacterium PtaU1.Bin034]